MRRILREVSAALGVAVRQVPVQLQVLAGLRRLPMRGRASAAPGTPASSAKIAARNDPLPQLQVRGRASAAPRTPASSARTAGARARSRASGPASAARKTSASSARIAARLALEQLVGRSTCLLFRFRVAQGMRPGFISYGRFR